MKFNFRSVLTAVAIVSIAFSSCKKDDSPTPTPPSDDEGVNTSILVYGATGGGGELDQYQVAMLLKAMNVGCSKRIKLVSQYNFFKAGQSYEYLKGTQRMIVHWLDAKQLQYTGINYSGCVNEQDSIARDMKVCDGYIKEAVEKGGITIEKASDTPLKLWEPETIADFIKYAAVKCPADRYILWITGHGGGWNPTDEKTRTKAVAWDDNYPEDEKNNQTFGISARELAEGIKKSGLADKIKLIEMDACYMNRLENMAEYAESGAKYAQACYQSSYGGDFSGMIAHLRENENTDAGFDRAVRRYQENWRNPDITTWDLTKVATLNKAIGEFVPLFADEYKGKTADFNKWMNDENIMHYSGKGHKSDERSFGQFIDYIAKGNYDDKLKKSAVTVQKALKDATPWGTSYSDGSGYKEGCLVSVDFKNKDSYKNALNTAGDSYEKSVFYQTTKWNTLFELFTLDN